MYDDGSQQRTYKRLKVEESAYVFFNCVPLKEIYCQMSDFSGQLVIPQPPRTSTVQIPEEMQFEYYELDMNNTISEDTLVFEPLVHNNEGEESVYEEDEDDSNGENYYMNDYPDEYNPRFSCNNNFDPDDYYDDTL